jgi:hypothetical protein
MITSQPPDVPICGRGTATARDHLFPFEPQRADFDASAGAQCQAAMPPCPGGRGIADIADDGTHPLGFRHVWAISAKNYSRSGADAHRHRAWAIRFYEGRSVVTRSTLRRTAR